MPRGLKDIHDIHSDTQLSILPMASGTQNDHEKYHHTTQLGSSEYDYLRLRLRTIAPKPLYVPPLNFSLVEDRIYRLGFPMPINYPFLKQLGLKTIIYLGDLGQSKGKDGEKKKKKDKHGTADIMDSYTAWVKTTDITFHHLMMESSQEPFTLQEELEQSQASLTKALQLMVDKQNFPILIHSNKGKHRIGVLVGLIRKLLQGWCMSGIFEEYEKFAMGKSEFDLEFIETWQPELWIDEAHIPEFVRIDQ